MPFAAPLIVLLALTAAAGAPGPGAAVPRRASSQAIGHYVRARLADAAGDRAAAIEELRQALVHDGASPQLRTAYAEALARAGRLDRAEAEARRAVELAGPSGAAAADARLVLGKVLALARDPDRATAELREAARLEAALAPARDADDEERLAPDAWRILSRIQVDAGDDDGAAATLDGLAALAPGDAAVALRDLAAKLADSRAPDRAERFARRAVELVPSEGEAWRILARLDESRGRFAQAKSGWERTLAADPDDADALLALGRLALREGDLSAAHAWFSHHLASDPDTAGAKARVASAYLDARRFDDALDAASGDDDPRALLLRGLALQGKKRWPQAAEVFARVPPSNDEVYATARTSLAYALSHAGRHAEAAKALEEPLRARPRDARLLATLAYVLERGGRPREAADLLRDAIAARERDGLPGAGELYEGLASALERAGHRDEAIASLRRAVADHPQDESLLYALGSAYERAGDGDAAIAQMRAVLAVNPAHADALNFVGYAYAERGERLDEAQGLLERALAIEPENAFFLDSLGWVFFKKGDAVEAVKLLEKADALAGPEATILEHLGDAYWSAGRSGDAVAAYRRALKASDAPADDAAEPPPAAQRATLERKLRELGARDLRPAASTRH